MSDQAIGNDAKHTGIALVEGRYWEESNVSYRSIFDLISETQHETVNGYHYETANSEASMSEILPRLARQKNIKYLCLAGHGMKGYLTMINGDSIRCNKIADLVASAPQGGNCHGIHISACKVVDESVAKSMLDLLPAGKWVSGYSRWLGWIDGSALDMLLFQKLSANSKRRPLPNIKAVAKEIFADCPGLVERLGFGIFVRDSPYGEVQNLCLPY